ncbi:MAG: tetratricopeptide repeat protein [Trueperaceae bacterium]|nr:tetratricopeptide repeat protein [Trueperaceae bacterium]
MAVELELAINQKEMNTFDHDQAISVAFSLFKQASEHFSRGDFDVAEMFLMKASVVFRAEQDPTGQINVLLLQGTIKRDQGNLEQALLIFRQAGDIALQIEDKLAQADALNLEASVFSYQGQDLHAVEALKQAIELVKDSDHTEKIMNLYCNIGSIYTFFGDYSEALNFLSLAYGKANLLKRPSRGQAILLSQLGALYQSIGNIDEAVQFQVQARDVCRKLGDSYTESAVLNNLGQLRLVRGEVDEAKQLYLEALKIASRAGNAIYKIDNLLGLGHVYKSLKDYDRANKYYVQALEIADQSGKRDVKVEILHNLGSSLLELGEFQKAETDLLEALALAAELEHPKSIFEIHKSLSEVYETTGDLAKALHHHKEFHRVEKLIFNEEADKRTKQLSVRFDVERSRHEAEEYRLRNEMAQKARLEAEAIVTERSRELESAHLEVVTRLAVAAEFRDDDTGEHTKRVGRTAAAIAHVLGWSQEEVKLLYTAARLHDVGKIGVPDAILLKPGRLSEQEFEIIRQHTTIGGRILANGQTRLLKLAEEIALYHHERWDGTGYPLKLAAEAIPMAARIVSVADVLDALSQERPYKRAWSMEETLAEIRRQSGAQFDPEIVEACLTIYTSEEGRRYLETVDSWQDSLVQLDALNVKKTSTMMGSTDLFKIIERYEKQLETKEKLIAQLQLESEQVRQDLKQMSFADPLTRLGNRLAFEKDLESALSRPEGSHEVMVVTLDLDGLKDINASLGYAKGDELLQHFAKEMKEEFRSCGTVYRSGGDEFIGLVAQRLLPKFSEIQGHLDAVLVRLSAQGLPRVSVSIGVAAFPQEAKSPGELIRLSDQRMFADKVEKRSHDRQEARVVPL